jgi:hypothetical protein
MASAGTVILEQVVRVKNPQPPWPEQNARRWELTTPLSKLAHSGQPEEVTPYVKRYHYGIDWQILRMKGRRFGFPVQVQAHFPERGNRQTVELLFVVTSWIPHHPPFVQSLALWQGDNLPPFALLPVTGRPILDDPSSSSEESPREVINVEDLELDENRVARLLLRLEEELPDGGSAWLEGKVIMGFVGSLSGLQLEAFYDPFGCRVRPPRNTTITRTTLEFRLDLSALPYQSSSVAACSCVLPDISEERDDDLVRKLERHSRVVRVHERMAENPLIRDGTTWLPPARDVTGHWLSHEDDEMAPVVYSLHLTPYQDGARVEIQVEAPVTSAVQHPSRAEKVCEQLLALIGCSDATTRITPVKSSEKRES